MATEYHRIAHEVHAGAFGSGDFGKFGETIARFFGTPQYLIGQTLVVVVWIVFNGYELLVHFDPYPFILLNLAFSTQAAYAAPLILMSSNRQASKDEARDDLEAKEVEDLHSMTAQIQQITLTQKDLMSDVHAIAKHLGIELTTPKPNP